LQIVNGGTATMWIRYAGTGISVGERMDWKPFITSASVLNGHRAHPWSDTLPGQGYGFRLCTGDYQIVPYSGSAAWFGGALGCGRDGQGCGVNPLGRGQQPTTLFEWTNTEYGVWDASMVDGFQIPMQVQVQGVPTTYLRCQESLCPNKQLDSEGRYVGCKSMCACQGPQPYSGKADPDCPGMTVLSDMPSFPSIPANEEARKWGYCGCSVAGCSPWLNDLFSEDKAGEAYCDAVTKMTANAQGQRSVYCQAYDDKSGTRSNGKGIIKVVLCNEGFTEFKGDTPCV